MCDILLSNFAFKFNLRRHIKVDVFAALERTQILVMLREGAFLETHPPGKVQHHYARRPSLRKQFGVLVASLCFGDLVEPTGRFFDVLGSMTRQIDLVCGCGDLPPQFLMVEEVGPSST
jgi:hypothetical protein